MRWLLPLGVFAPSVGMCIGAFSEAKDILLLIIKPYERQLKPSKVSDTTYMILVGQPPWWGAGQGFELMQVTACGSVS